MTGPTVGQSEVYPVIAPAVRYLCEFVNMVNHSSMAGPTGALLVRLLVACALAVPGGLTSAR